MKKHIICLGDSNTHGYCADPAGCADGGCRFNENERWPMLMAKALGNDYLVIEEGLSGRTTVFPDPLTEGLDAVTYVTPMLMSHEPVDLLIIMLGTNDVKERFSASAACIAKGLERLVTKAANTPCWASAPNILVVAPPPIEDGLYTSAVACTMGAGCVEKSRELSLRYKASAELLGVHFMDAAGCEFNKVDFMHLTVKGHEMLAERMTKAVQDLV